MADVVAAILAGGVSRRMGRAKATLELARRPLISYPLAAAKDAGLDPVVVAKADSELPAIADPVLLEPESPRHPLAGVLAALGSSGGRPVLAIGCDMPFVTADLLAWLASAEEPLVVPALRGRLQPLLTLYTAHVAEALAAALEAEEPVHRALARLGPRIVGENELARFGDSERLLFNINTPADLQRAEELLSGGTTSTSAL